MDGNRVDRIRVKPLDHERTRKPQSFAVLACHSKPSCVAQNMTPYSGHGSDICRCPGCWLPVTHGTATLCAARSTPPNEENNHGSIDDHTAVIPRNDRQCRGRAAGTLVTLESARGYAANDTLNVACLGTGGRCMHLMKALVQVPGVRIAAVCDVYDAHLHAAQKLADSKAIATKHYREILDRKDIDAVLIASPDHWHVPMSVDACEAGKDVYVEKPLTHDLAEGVGDRRRSESDSEDRSGRHAATKHAPHSKGTRAGQGGTDR